MHKINGTVYAPSLTGFSAFLQHTRQKTKEGFYEQWLLDNFTASDIYTFYKDEPICGALSCKGCCGYGCDEE